MLLQRTATLMSRSMRRYCTNTVAAYENKDLVAKVEAALVEMGYDLSSPAPLQLPPFDELHIGLRPAVLNFAQSVSFPKGAKILDLGSGTGATSRCFAQLDPSCHVYGIDLTKSFVQLSQRLAELEKLDDRSQYVLGTVTDVPFESNMFDGAYTLHVGMNVEDKAKFYAEAFRCLKPGGTFGVYDAMLARADAVEHIDLPLPFAVEKAAVFLRTPGQYMTYLEEAGFKILSARDVTEFGMKANAELLKEFQTQNGPPPLHKSLFPPDFGQRGKNIQSALLGGHLVAFEIVCKKPE
eukprot:m.93855 g.93855  ORF g.93855 m.93855 type:complete len:295 (+) comp21814_c0_seq4:47-931(+)